MTDPASSKRLEFYLQDHVSSILSVCMSLVPRNVFLSARKNTNIIESSKSDSNRFGKHLRFLLAVRTAKENDLRKEVTEMNKKRKISEGSMKDIDLFELQNRTVVNNSQNISTPPSTNIVTAPNSQVVQENQAVVFPRLATP
eukprot:TRINITY_DN207_c0_g1_i13.p3 TRINITY_DN207_c0_g1~~TRINITY_DN207_c0_g1_i13.p3  ORF type:complete len:142 (-),score=28.96 TRINITY_DN207_c0_g1_i13:150-575(-)